MEIYMGRFPNTSTLVANTTSFHHHLPPILHSHPSSSLSPPFSIPMASHHPHYHIFTLYPSPSILMASHHYTSLFLIQFPMTWHHLHHHIFTLHPPNSIPMASYYPHHHILTLYPHYSIPMASHHLTTTFSLFILLLQCPWLPTIISLSTSFNSYSFPPPSPPYFHSLSSFNFHAFPYLSPPAPLIPTTIPLSSSFNSHGFPTPSPPYSHSLSSSSFHGFLSPPSFLLPLQCLSNSNLTLLTVNQAISVPTNLVEEGGSGRGIAIEPNEGMWGEGERKVANMSSTGIGGGRGQGGGDENELKKGKKRKFHRNNPKYG